MLLLCLLKYFQWAAADTLACVRFEDVLRFVAVSAQRSHESGRFLTVIIDPLQESGRMSLPFEAGQHANDGDGMLLLLLLLWRRNKCVTHLRQTPLHSDSLHLKVAVVRLRQSHALHPRFKRPLIPLSTLPHRLTSNLIALDSSKIWEQIWVPVQRTRGKWIDS